MSDYTELVKALRSASTISSAWEKLMVDAAAAIEALEAENEKLRDTITIQDAALHPNPRYVEPKRGEWIDDGTKYGIRFFKCSVCGDSRDMPTVMRKPYFKYCPMCGAKMEVQDGTD